MAATKRRTQDERSADTRRRLIEATLDCLYAEGAARTSTNMIAAAASVSRGALTHHYASKEDLIVDALEFLLREATNDIRDLATKLRNQELNIDGFLDALCDMFLGRLMMLTLEHVTEARHNEHLREHMVRTVKIFHKELDTIWRELFCDENSSEQDVTTTLNMTLCLFRGMGLQSVLRDDPQYYRQLRDAWKLQLCGLLGLDENRPIDFIHHMKKQGEQK